MFTEMRSVRYSVMHYLEQLWAGFSIKAIVAGIGTFFVHILHGDLEVLAIYVGLSFLDLILGIMRAVALGTFEMRYLTYWMRKMLTCMLLVVAMGLVCHSLMHTLGVTLTAVNWLLFCCSLTELASIITNLRKLGLPIPRIVTLVCSALRKKAAKHIGEGLGDEKLVEKIERALNDDRNGMGGSAHA